MKRLFAVATLLAVCLQLPHTEGAIACTSNDACHCKGDGIDISWDGQFDYPLNFSYTNEKGDSYTFSFSPCADVSCGSEQKVAVCQYDPTANKGEGGFTSIGSRDQVEWDVTSATVFTVVYSGGTQTWDNKERKAIVAVNATTNGKSTLVSTGEDDLEKEIDYNFKAALSTSGPQPSSGSVSLVGIVGIVILFLLLAAVIAYFVIGGIVMYTVKGARGVEVIPQYTFWKSLPFLIKDGFMFTISPCVNKCGKQGGYSSL